MTAAIRAAIGRAARITVLTMPAPGEDRGRGRAVVETSVPRRLARMVAHARVAAEVGDSIASCTLRVVDVVEVTTRRAGRPVWWVSVEWLPRPGVPTTAER